MKNLEGAVVHCWPVLRPKFWTGFGVPEKRHVVTTYFVADERPEEQLLAHFYALVGVQDSGLVDSGFIVLAVPRQDLNNSDNVSLLEEICR